MINTTIEDWFELAVGYGFDQMIRKDGFGVPLAHMEAEFKTPSQLDDTLVFTLGVREIGRSSIKLTVTARCEGELRMTAWPTLVYIRSDTNKPVRIPERMREVMLGYQETA